MSLTSTVKYSRDVSGLLACSTSEGDVIVWELQVHEPTASVSPSSGGAAGVVAAGTVGVQVSTVGFLCVTGGNAQRRVLVFLPNRCRYAIQCNVLAFFGVTCAPAVPPSLASMLCPILFMRLLELRIDDIVRLGLASKNNFFGCTVANSSSLSK